MNEGDRRWCDLRYIRSAALDALAKRVAAIATDATVLNAHRIGRLTLPLLILGGTNTQTLTWSKPMPNGSYEVSVQQDAAIIGSVTIAVLSITAAAVQIRTTATVAISAGAQLLVIGYYQ